MSGPRKADDVVSGPKKADDAVSGPRKADDAVSGARKADDAVSEARKADDAVSGLTAQNLLDFFINKINSYNRCRCVCQLRQLRFVRNELTSDASKTVVHASVSSRVDYCNSVFSLTRAKHLRPLQPVLNVAACVTSI